MLLFPAVIITWASLMVTTVQLQCDPDTQYSLNDQCCIMCGPGTSMAKKDCLKPECKPCSDGEYQEKYTTEEKCQLQPYCDPNKNFEFPSNQKVTKKTSCKCKLGYHCSSLDCISCMQNKICPPGKQAQIKDTVTGETKCEECPSGTFSNVSLWNSACKKWSTCGDGYYVWKEGTTQSDNVCEKNPRTYIGVISVFSVLAVIVLFGLLYWKYRCFSCFAFGEPENVKDTVKDIVGKTQREEPRLRHMETHVLVPDSQSEKDFPSPEQESTQEESSTLGHQTPEENMDEQTANGFTERGNFVTQELGKSEILSRQESQSQSHTFTELLGLA